MDPLVELFNYPRTIWRGEVWNSDPAWGSSLFHLVFPYGKSFAIIKRSGILLKKDGIDFNILSDCYNRKTKSGGEFLEANPSGPQTCLTHDTALHYDSYAMVFRPPGEPHLLYQVREVGRGSRVQGVHSDETSSDKVLGDAVIYSCTTGHTLQ